MGLLNLFKSRKSKLKDAFDEILKQIFPGGTPQMEREVEEVHSMYKGKYSRGEVKNFYFHAATLFYISEDKSEDRIVAGILRRPENVFEHEDIRKLFPYLMKKFVQQNLGDEVIGLFSNKAFGDNEGTDKDEIPGGRGAFGLEVTNPVPVQGIISNEIYLGRLRTLDGKPITWKRIGSTRTEGIENPIDMYRVFNVLGQEITTLYISPYHKKISGKAPSGFKLI